MKGYRTIIIMALVSLAGWAVTFIDSIKEQLATCTTTATSEVIAAGTEVIEKSQLCELGIPGWVIGVLGALGVVLRFVTTSPVGKK